MPPHVGAREGARRGVDVATALDEAELGGVAGGDAREELVAADLRADAGRGDCNVVALGAVARLEVRELGGERAEEATPVGDDAAALGRRADEGRGALALEHVELAARDVGVDDLDVAHVDGDPGGVRVHDPVEGEPLLVGVGSGSEALRVGDARALEPPRGRGVERDRGQHHRSERGAAPRFVDAENELRRHPRIMHPGGPGRPRNRFATRVPVAGILAPMTMLRWGALLLASSLAACASSTAGRTPVAGAQPAGAAEAEGGARGAAPSRTFVYVGMTGGAVATFHLDLATGALARRGSIDVGRSPSSLARSAEREVVLAVDEATGQAAALAVNAKTGALTPSARLAAGGAQPAGAVVDGTGKYLLIAHPGGGSVSVLAITPGGGLGEIGTFPAGAGATAVALHPANQVAFVANARASTVSQYTFNTGTGILTPKAGPPLALPAGSGPARFACHPSGRWVYILDEVSRAISVHVFDEDVKALSPISSQIVSTLAEGARGKSRPVDLALGHGGRFLYATNRGADDVATFAVRPDGTLEARGHEPSGGHGAGALAVDTTGSFLFVANQASKTIVVFRLDPSTGAPSVAHTVTLAASPLSLLAASF